MSTNFKRRVIDKDESYDISLLRDQTDTVFTNRGAAAEVEFGLPTPGFQYLGVRYRARGIADFAFGFVGAAAGDIVTKNDAAADSVKAQTAGEIIGAVIEAECIKTGDATYKWAVAGLAVGHTYTVA